MFFLYPYPFLKKPNKKSIIKKRENNIPSYYDNLLDVSIALLVSAFIYNPEDFELSVTLLSFPGLLVI